MKQVGRDELTAKLSEVSGLTLDEAKSAIRGIFGSGGGGPAGGTRDIGVLEMFLERDYEVNVRGFGKFSRAEYKAHKRKINGVEVQCRAKSKISFHTSQATDIIK